MTKRLSFFILMAWVISAGLASVVYAEQAPIEMGQPGGPCPVMKGRIAKKKFHVDMNGKRVYLCCRSCEKAFKKRPEKYGYS